MSDRAKILHVIASMNPDTGGVCKAVRMIVASLESRGVNNEVVTLDAPSASYLAEDVFITHALGPAKTPWRYARQLRPWLKKNLANFDIVVLHGLWLYNGYALYKTVEEVNEQRLSNGQVPLQYFVMPHGMLDPYFQNAPGRSLKALRNLLYWKLIEKNVVNNADAILFTCEEEQRLARKPFKPYTPKAENVVGLGLDAPPEFEAEMRRAFLLTCPQLNNSPYFLFLGRIDEKKGVDLLLEAYKDIVVLKDAPDLVIAGPGLQSSYGREILAQAQSKHGLKARIHFPGMLSGMAKWGAIYGCESFILPSHQENFGIAVVEALACRKPVLISEEVNIWKEIAAAGAGLIEKDTLEGTRNMLRKWLALSVEEHDGMCLRARQAFETHFSIHSAAHNFMDAISSNVVQADCHFERQAHA